jgi:mannose-6-phosphate isomerase-like protein (cupin superfamily)
MMKTRYIDVPAYVTKDGCIIRELMHPAQHGNDKQSIAEATVPVGGTTLLHIHKLTEEIYVIIKGVGLMRLDEDLFTVNEGDTIAILPGQKHNLRNIGDCELKLLCNCSPAYSHKDTYIVGESTE